MHLEKGPTMTKHNGENYSNGSWFNYQAERVMMINAKSCLVTS